MNNEISIENKVDDEVSDPDELCRRILSGEKVGAMITEGPKKIQHPMKPGKVTIGVMDFIGISDLIIPVEVETVLVETETLVNINFISFSNKTKRNTRCKRCGTRGHTKSKCDRRKQ